MEFVLLWLIPLKTLKRLFSEQKSQSSAKALLLRFDWKNKHLIEASLDARSVRRRHM